jgi:hypothetical protein
VCPARGSTRQDVQSKQKFGLCICTPRGGGVGPVWSLLATRIGCGGPVLPFPPPRSPHGGLTTRGTYSVLSIHGRVRTTGDIGEISNNNFKKPKTTQD